nr:1-acyl-sn-glycerol-3-phosphate acyltransferase [Bacteroidota bacterium]
MPLKFTIKNIVIAIWFLITIIISVLLMLPGLLLLAIGQRTTSDRYLNRLGTIYSRHLLMVFGARVTVNGLENLPETNRICFVSNHQGLMDIPMIAGYIPKTVGFIAKKELGKIPILNIWLRAMNCVLIDRSNPRSSIGTMQLAIKNIQKGHAMVIFPEGTRSRQHEMGKFKSGSFKLVTGSDALAVPLTINGSYKVIEETGKITSSEIILTIHPAINVSELSRSDKAGLSTKVETQIRSVL